MNEAYAVIGIGICIMLFLLVLLGIGEFYGGDWNVVAQGVAKFTLLIVGFAFGVYVLWSFLGRK